MYHNHGNGVDCCISNTADVSSAWIAGTPTQQVDNVPGLHQFGILKCNLYLGFQKCHLAIYSAVVSREVLLCTEIQDRICQTIHFYKGPCTINDREKHTGSTEALS